MRCAMMEFALDLERNQCRRIYSAHQDHPKVWLGGWALVGDLFIPSQVIRSTMMALAMNTYRGDFDKKLGDWKTQWLTLRKDQIVSK